MTRLGLIKLSAVEEKYQKVFFGKQEILIPIYNSITQAVSHQPQAGVLINYASHRSAYESSLEALKCKTIWCIVITAEGVPESQIKHLIAFSNRVSKTIIGPATVGGIQAGAFKFGDAGGTITNIIESKLYRPGSVGLVTKSGGLSNEMYRILSKNTDGIYESIVIGGDTFPGSTMLEHVLRYEQIPQVKMIVLLGEIGGSAENEVAQAMKKRQITKSVVALVTGSSASLFRWDAQFGHAGAKISSESQSAHEKNKALQEAGAVVPDSFDNLGTAIAYVYNSLRRSGTITTNIGYEDPNVIPENYAKIIDLCNKRRPTAIISTICNDLREEPMYGGLSVSHIIEKELTIGDVISLLWFKRSLPRYATRFIEMIIILTADHGPCVSGAHNTIVAARAGKDIVSSVASGLLTIGSRFGGAIDDAAREFRRGLDTNLSVIQFVEGMKATGKLIPGIGHRIKSVQNPDLRVELLKNYARNMFSSLKHLNYAVQVENYTSKKANRLILNIDGAIAVLFLDLMESSDLFSKKEIDEMVDIGFFNGLFILSRSIGLIGHALDQKRLKQPLYRHPIDDVMYYTDVGNDIDGKEAAED